MESDTVPVKPLLLQAENLTLFIKNTVTFSKFNCSRSAWGVLAVPDAPCPLPGQTPSPTPSQCCHCDPGFTQYCSCSPSGTSWLWLEGSVRTWCCWWLRGGQGSGRAQGEGPCPCARGAVMCCVQGGAVGIHVCWDCDPDAGGSNGDPRTPSSCGRGATTSGAAPMPTCCPSACPPVAAGTNPSLAHSSGPSAGPSCPHALSRQRASARQVPACCPCVRSNDTGLRPGTRAGGSTKAPKGTANPEQTEPDSPPPHPAAQVP
ncbi:hypothetical protein HPG69_016530 [Diceros bicornis minor]|uniref:Uncharacterized protein n=1 Tax=Diceros bicornis minor TaxID=77932 RepID=A0A7J7F5N5_DICBM|nr:hypothetical protein HPG69_016530 [Diceros bicornis minor]